MKAADHMTDSRIPEFWQLVLHAERSGKAVDSFDLHGDDPQSRIGFQRLWDEQNAAALKLIEYVAANAEQLRRDLSDMHFTA